MTGWDLTWHLLIFEWSFRCCHCFHPSRASHLCMLRLHDAELGLTWRHCVTHLIDFMPLFSTKWLNFLIAAYGSEQHTAMKQSFNIWLIDNISENSMHMRGRAFAYNVCIHACLFAGKEPIVYYTMEKQHSTGRWILTKGQLGGCIWTTLNEYKSFCLMVFMHVCRCTHIHDGMNCLLICSFASAAWHLWWTQPRFHSYQPHCGCHSLSFSQNRQPKHAWHDFWTYSESSFEPNHVPLAVMQKRLTAQNLWISFSWETWSNHIKPNIHSNPISVSNQTSGGSVAKSSELMSWYLGSAVSHVARQGPNHGTKPLPKLVQVNRLFNDCKLYFLYPYTCMYKSWLNMFIVSYIYMYL